MKRRYFLVFGIILFVLVFSMFSSGNYTFQLRAVEKGTWEEIPIKPVVTSADPIDDYIDATYSTTYGTVTNGPPNGMGVDSDGPSGDTELLEAGYSEYSYSTVASHTGGSLPSGWYNYHWTFYASYVKISGASYTSGYFDTDTYDMSSYVGVRIYFYWTTLEGAGTGKLKVYSYESSSWVQVWSSPYDEVGGSYEVATIDRGAYPSNWDVKWEASGLGSALPDGFQIDNIYLYGKVATTYYRFEAVFNWNSVDYSSYTWSLSIDFYTAMSGSDDLDFYIGTSTNPTNLVGDDKQNDFNVDVTAYVTGSTVYLKIKDDYRSGDAGQTTAYIQRCWLYGTPVNAVPTNDGTPTCSNLDDSVALYAHKREYSITTYANDADGYADIHYMELYIYNAAETINYYRVQYHEDDNSFSEQYDAGTMATINTGSSSAVRSGNDIDATFVITIDWDFIDLTSFHIKCFVWDALGASDTDWYAIGWNIETRLDYVTAPSVSDGSGTVDRGDIDGSFTATGTLEYYGSASNVYPPDDHVDVWASCSEYGTTTGPFSDLTLSSGALSITCYADDVVGIDTWTFKPVEDGAGSGGTSLYYTTDLTDTYISDRVQVQSYTVADSRVNINDNVNIDALLYYDYDDSAVTDGTVTINGYSATHQGSGTWRITRMSASVTSVTYNTVAVSGNTHDITSIDQNGQSTSVIWDRVKILTTTVDDSRVNINDNVEIRVTAYLEYDSHYLGSGDTITLDGVAMTWDAVNSWFDLARAKSSVGAWLFYVNTTSEATYGITQVNLDGKEVTVIWDRVKVISYTVADARVNINVNVDIDVLLYYEYDSAFVTDGTVTVNGYSATHQGSGVWRITRTSASVTGVTYNTVTATGNTYGITEMNQNGQSKLVIWDRVQVVTSVCTDDRVGIDTQGVIQFTLIYDYDDTAIGASGGTFKINGTTATWEGSYWQATFSSGESIVGKYYYVLDYASATLYGITAYDNNGLAPYIIYDRILIKDWWAVDTRGSYAMWQLIDAVYEYDNTPFDDTHPSSTIEINSTKSMGFGTSGYGDYWNTFWNTAHLGSDSSVVGNYTFTVTSVHDYVYGIIDKWAFDTGVNEYIWMILDAIVPTIVNIDDGIYGTSTNGYIYVTAILAYDSHPLGSGDQLTLYDNGMSPLGTMTWDSVNERFYRARTESTDGNYTYYIASGYEGTYGVNTILSGDYAEEWLVFDTINLTVSSNYSWTIIDYNVTMSATGLYNYLGWIWNGSILTTNSTSGTIYLDESASGTWYFVVLTISNDDHENVTVFTQVNDLSVIFDDVIPASSIVKYWVQYSATQVNLIWGTGSTWKLQIYNTWLTNSYSLHAYSNGSSPQSSGGIYGSGSFGGMAIGFYTPSWHFVDLTINCTVTIGTRSFNWIIWEEVLSVDILHSIHIEDSVIFLSDDYVTFGIYTNWANSTFYIWDNVTGTPVYQGGSEEGWYQIPKSATVGTHQLIILVNGTQGTIDSTSQSASDSDNDSWVYLTFRYTVNPTLIELTIYSISESTTKVLVSGICNLAVSYYVYVSDVLQGSGSISASVSFSIPITKSLATAGSFDYGIYFNTSSDSKWFNGTYEVPQSAVFGVTLWDVDFGDVYINIFCQTTYRNATLYIYDNGVYRAYSLEADIVQYRKLTTEGIHNLAVLINATCSYTWKNLTYTVAVMVEALKLTELAWDTGSPTSVSGSIMTNWNNATVTITQSGVTVFTATESGGGYGVSFYFLKVQTEGVIHIVTVTITSGSSTLTLTLGYSYRPQADGGGLPPSMPPQWMNQTANAVNDALLDRVVMSPPVFWGIFGLVVIFVTIIIGQLAYHRWKDEKRGHRQAMANIVSGGQGWWG